MGMKVGCSNKAKTVQAHDATHPDLHKYITITLTPYTRQLVAIINIVNMKRFAVDWTQ